MSDLKQWGVDESWSASLETLRTGRGDCEDYAIAKYVALTAAGVAPEDVKLVIVRDLAVGDGHVVVAAHVDGSWIVLDNRWLTLVEDNKMRACLRCSSSIIQVTERTCGYLPETLRLPHRESL